MIRNTNETDCHAPPKHNLPLARAFGTMRVCGCSGSGRRCARFPSLRALINLTSALPEVAMENTARLLSGMVSVCVCVCMLHCPLSLLNSADVVTLIGDETSAIQKSPGSTYNYSDYQYKAHSVVGGRRHLGLDGNTSEYVSGGE